MKAPLGENIIRIFPILGLAESRFFGILAIYQTLYGDGDAD